MKTSKNIFLALIIVATILSCKKNGTGGDATVAALTKHHGKAIPFSTVYIKYDAKDFPGDDLTKYDASQKTDKDGHTHFESLRYGQYYFYGVGYDSAALATVKGGLAVQIKWKDRKEELEVIIPVTE